MPKSRSNDPKKKHELTEGIIPYLTQKGVEEFTVGRAMNTIGGAVKKAARKVGIPTEGHPSTQKRKKGKD